MKLFSGKQIRACDTYTIDEEGILSINLMEKAAQGIFEKVHQDYSRDYIFCFLCGMGNNGGDGLALARILIENGFRAHVYLLRYTQEFSRDADINYQRLMQLMPDAITELQEGQMPVFKEKKIIIADAIFGSGLSRPLAGWLANVVQYANSLHTGRIAVDMPSGLMADDLPGENDIIFKADHTYTIQLAKRTFFHPESAVFAGTISYIHIGLSTDYIQFEPTTNFILDEAWAKTHLQPRSPFANKGDFGRVAIVAGSYGKMGAAVLSTAAALRAGAGLVFTLAPQCGYNILQTAVPEAMFVDSGKYFLEQVNLPSDKARVGVGPGLGTDEQSVTALSHFLENTREPVVMDADALNILAAHSSMWISVPEYSILSPHPKEFERLFGRCANTLSRTEAARARAVKHKVVIVLKGHYTVICTPDGNCFYNTTGNAGMATGGSGDVLTGILSSLIAQGYDSITAACLGVYLHGLAGDLAREACGEEALIAGDIVRHLGKAFLKING